MIAYFVKINDIPLNFDGKILKDKKYPALAEFHIKHFTEQAKGIEQIMYQIKGENDQKLLIPQSCCVLLREVKK